MGALDVWVARPGMACRVDDLDWTVHVSDAHLEPYTWAGTSYANLPAPNAHWAGTLPPGTYVVHATRRAARKGEPTRAEATIVEVGCDEVACVRLFVAGKLRREPEKPPYDDEKPPREEDKPPQDEERPDDREQGDDRDNDDKDQRRRRARPR